MMKKLGTPIGAGPGSDSENVGFLADGTPLPLGRSAGLLGFLARACLDAGWLAFFGCPDGTWVWGCDEDFWPWLLEVGAGVVADRLVVVLGEPPEREGEVEVEPDVVLDPEEELLELAGGGGGALLVVVEVLELAGVQEPDTKVAPTGRATCCGVVPGGAST